MDSYLIVAASLLVFSYTLYAGYSMYKLDSALDRVRDNTSTACYAAKITAIQSKPIKPFTATAECGVSYTWESYKFPNIDIEVGNTVYIKMVWYDNRLPARFFVMENLPSDLEVECI